MSGEESLAVEELKDVVASRAVLNAEHHAHELARAGSAQTSSGPKAYVSRTAGGRAARARSKSSTCDEAGFGCGSIDEDDDMLKAK